MRRLVISRDTLAALSAHLVAAHPEEGCGILVGRDLGEVRLVEEAVAVENASAEDRRRRYDIHPERFLEVDRRARATGLEVIGFFHSHPGHPPEPSAFDCERAWAYYSYLIASVAEGRVTEIRSWRLADDGTALEPEAWGVMEPEGEKMERRA